MSEEFTPREEESLLAAEYALGLLDGQDLAVAARRADEDPRFAAEVDLWNERFSPLLDQIAPYSPRPTVWDQIEARIAKPDNVVQLRRRVRVWRGYSAGVTALAASLALVVGLDLADRSQPPSAKPGPTGPTPVLVAAVTPEGGVATITASFDPQTRSLVVVPAALSPQSGRDQELWIVPANGNPVSLGVLRAGSPMRQAVSRDAARLIQAHGTLAISIEPVGGSPTGLPTGPIAATGTLTQI